METDTGLIVDASRRTSPNIDSRILSNHLCEYIDYGLRHGFVVDCDEIFRLRIHLEGSVKAECCFNLLRTWQDLSAGFRTSILETRTHCLDIALLPDQPRS